jgi:hypothetical protein
VALAALVKFEDELILKFENETSKRFNLLIFLSKFKTVFFYSFLKHRFDRENTAPIAIEGQIFDTDYFL